MRARGTTAIDGHAQGTVQLIYTTERCDLSAPPACSRASPGPYQGLDELAHPDRGAFVRRTTRPTLFRARKLSLSHAFARQHVWRGHGSAVTWLVTLTRYDFGLCRRRDVSAGTDRESVQPGTCYPCRRNERLPMCPERTHVGMVRPAGFEPATSWFVARRSIQLS